MSTTEIKLDKSKNIPYIENVCDYSLEYVIEEKNKVTKMTIIGDNSSGIIIDCLPGLNGFSSPSTRFKSKTTVLKRNNKKNDSINISKNMNTDSNSNKLNEVPFTSTFSDKKENNVVTQLENKTEHVSTSTNILTNIKNDESLSAVYSSFNENKQIPDVIKILNNVLESIFIPEDSIERQNYIYELTYPLNYSNSLDLREGTFLEPFSLINVIQFKENQEKSFNKFHCDMNTSHNVRHENIYFYEKTNINYQNKNIEFLDINNKNAFYVNKQTNQKEYISPLTHIVTKDISKNRIKPFYDYEYEFYLERYFNENYHDDNSSFYNSYKALNQNQKIFYENYLKDSTTIKYEKNDKYSMCGFDYSYTTGLGKSSIAFKGLE